MASRKGTGGGLLADVEWWSHSCAVAAFQRRSEKGRSIASSAKGRSGAVEKRVAVSRSAR